MTSANSVDRGQGELLSVDDSRARARPLVHWSKSDRTFAALTLAGALVRASRRWATGERFDAFAAVLAATDVVALPAENASDHLRLASWTPLAGDGSADAWWSCSCDPKDVLATALFDASTRTPTRTGEPTIALELAQECWNEQLAALAAAIVETGLPESPIERSSSVSAQCWRRWGGAVVLTLPWFGASLSLFLSERAMAFVRRSGGSRRAPQRREHGALVPVLAAIARSDVALQVRCQGVEIDLGSLVSLRLGDVLRLEHRLEAPMSICAAGPHDTAPLCQGWLGRVGDALSVELARTLASSR